MSKPSGVGRPSSVGRPVQQREVQTRRIQEDSAQQQTATTTTQPFGSGNFIDAQVDLSSAAAASGPGKGKGKGKAHGHNRNSDGFKNHGQRIKAAREAGFSGRDLAAVARGETAVEADGLAAIRNGDLSISDYLNARDSVSQGDFTLDDFLSGLKRVKDGDISFSGLLEELRNPPESETVETEAGVIDTTDAADATDEAPAPEPTSAPPVPSTQAPAEGLTFLARRGTRFGR